MALLEFDKLNTLSLIEIPEERRRSEPYDTYFGDMYLTEEQIESRKEVAEKMEEPLRNFLLLIMIGLASGVALYEEARRELLDSLIELGIAEVTYLEMLTREITDSTMRHVYDGWNGSGDTSGGGDTIDSGDTSGGTSADDWYFSEDRVIYISENEANTIENASDFAEAKRRGMRRKQWVGMADWRERDTHWMVNDRIIPIDAYFQVGEAQCLYPKDCESEYTTLPDHPEELVGCRCQAVYLP